MKTKFSTSTNIIRDESREISYIPTPNAVRVVNQISNDFHKGIRSFNIIGSYGTGKSSFLWALQKSLTGQKRYFDINLLQAPKVEVLNFIGEYKSITSAFADFFSVTVNKNKNENILAEIFHRYHQIGKKNPLLLIVLDEFGKFLEYASQHEPEKELYFIQQLSEFVNNPDHNIVLITTVHQNFDAYAFSLNNAQKQEWAKVKGRFREITFNEPIEQLLFLAAEHINQASTDKKINTEVRIALNIAKRSKAFNINPGFVADVANKLYPLDLIAANILTLSLQKYGQNERSLFSFLESTDHTGINSYDRLSNPFYNAACVYDYLVFNFYSYINSRYNPDFAGWAAIKNALDTAERTFEAEMEDYAKVIKTIGLLHMTAAAGSELDGNFLIHYSASCLGINDANTIVEALESRNIIAYRNYLKRYVIVEGTDLDITTALLEAGNKVGDVVDVVSLLKREYQLPPVIAKSYSYINGTPRLFEYRISDYPIDAVPMDEVDGFINLIFNDKLSLKDVKKASAMQEEAIIYGYYRNAKTIKNQLFEIEKTRKVITENQHDKTAIKELNNILLHQQNLLNHYILNNLYSNNAEVIWIDKGEEVIISNKREFNKLLSQKCQKVYPYTPVFKNELVNKHRISASIHTAKKYYFRALVDHWDKPDLGFDNIKFPPEKTIYITLLKQNGIELYSDKLTGASQDSLDTSFSHLWDYSLAFLDAAKKARRTIADFMEPLTRRPYKLKQGLIDFWTASFLFIKRDDYALFGESGYIPYLNEEILELLIKYPEDYSIKAFDIEGVKLDLFNSYRVFLNQHAKERLDNQSFIETIKPFLTFYRGLPEYSKKTKRLNKETLAVREAIANSKDPERSFFEDFPIALGFSAESLYNSKEQLQAYTINLQDAIRELRTSYNGLVQRFEDFILEEFIGEHASFEEYKARIQGRFSKLKKHLCLPHQKTFLQRLDSQLEDKDAWLNSIAQAVVGKPLEALKDEEEILLYDRFKALMYDLDSLNDLSHTDIDEVHEEILGIEMSSFVEGIQKGVVRLPKTKTKEAGKIEERIKSTLSKDNSVNIVAVANILKELLKK